MSNQDDQKKKGGGGGPHISDMILGSLRPRTGKETSKWIAGLADEVQDAVEAAAKQEEELAQAQAQQAQAQQAQSQQASRKDTKHDMMHVLDHLFDCFQQYEYEFNRTVHGTDLMVSIDRPQIATETIKQRFQPSETVQVFRGRISTRQWTLLIRGRDQMIEGWVIPIDKLISFSGDPSAYVRFLFMEAIWYNGELNWRIDGVEIPWDGVRTLAKQLFGALVKVARGEASDSEPFSLRPKAQVERSFDKMSAHQPEPGPGYAFEEKNPAFDSPFSNGKRPAVTADDVRQQAQQQPGNNSDPRLKERGIQTQPIQAGQIPDQPQQSGQHHILQAQPSGQHQTLPPQQSGQHQTVPPQQPMQQQQPPMGNQQQPMPHQQPPMGNQQQPMQHQQPPMGNQQQPMQHQQPPMGNQQQPMQHQQPPMSNQQQQPMPNQQPQMGQPQAPQPIQAIQQQSMQQQQPVPQMPGQNQPLGMPNPSISQQLPVIPPVPTIAAVSNDGVSLETALETLNLAVAHELDRLSKSGSEAFARQDFTAVEKAMKRAGKIKDLQAEIAAQVEQWKVRVREA